MYKTMFGFKIRNEFGECLNHGIVSKKLRSSSYLFEFVTNGHVIDSTTDSLDNFVAYWTKLCDSVEFFPLTKIPNHHE